MVKPLGAGTLVRNEKGLAMVLAISLIGLITSLALYLMVGSTNTYKTEKTMARHESALNLAEGALQLSLRCVRRSAPSPSYTQLTAGASSIMDITSGLPKYMSAQQSAGIGTITPSLGYVGVSTVPPAGWMMNWQGYSSFYGIYYRSRGAGAIALPASKGNAKADVSVLAEKITR